MTNLYFPTSIGSFCDRFSLMDIGNFLASARSSSVMLMSPRIQFKVGILNLNFFSVLLQDDSIDFWQL